MKKTLTVLLILSFLLSLSGCAASAVDYLGYSASPFSAVIEVKEGELEFSAEVTVGPPAGEGELRDISLTFLGPSRMKGLKIERRQGVITMQSGGISIKNSLAGGFLEIAGLLVPEGRVVDTKITEESGKKLAVITLSPAEGRILVFVDCDSGQPVRVTGESRGRQIEILVRSMQ